MFSQEREVDSLDQYSFQELNVKFNNAISQDGNLAKLYIEKIIEIANENQDSVQIIVAYNKLGNIEDQLGNIEEALISVEKAISISSKKSKFKKLEIYSILTKGIILFSRGKYKESFESLTIVYNFYKNGDKPYIINLIALNIAIIKNKLGDHATAIESLLKCYNKYNNTSEDDRNNLFPEDYLTLTLLALNDAYLREAIKNPTKKDFLLQAASKYTALGLEETTKTNNIPQLITFMTAKGVLYEEKGEYYKALEELDKALNKVKEFKQPGLFTSIYYHKGLCYKKLNQLDKAIDYLKKTDSVSQKNDLNYPILQGTYYALLEIYKDKQDFENIRKYQDLYIENDRINDHLSSTVRDDIHKKYDIDRLNLEIEALRRNRLKSSMIIGILILSLIIFYIFFRKHKQKNKIAFQKLIQKLEVKQEKTIIKKPTKSVIIDDEKVIQVLKALEKFEEKEWFLNKNCDLAFVAKKAKTNKTYLSKIVRERKELKFIDYIRNLRIDYALQRLKDDAVFRSYDIKSIAEESGFKSSDMFSRAFVKNTGIYPSYYIKNINKINT